MDREGVGMSAWVACKKLCANADRPGPCMQAARMSNYLRTRDDIAYGARAPARACTLGSATACFKMSMCELQPRRCRLDRPHADGLLELACAAGEHDACAEQSWCQLLAGGDSICWSEVFELFDEHCRAGSPRACTAQGNMYRLGLGTEEDSDIAEQRYQFAYDAGYRPACRAFVDGFYPSVLLRGMKGPRLSAKAVYAAVGRDISTYRVAHSTSTSNTVFVATARHLCRPTG